MKSYFKFWTAGLGIALSILQANAQGLLVKAIVRDFYEQRSSVTDSREHPHFEPTVNNPETNNAKALGISIAQTAISTGGTSNAVLQGLDTTMYKLDKRNPLLVSSLDSRVAWAYTPTSRFSDWYNDVPTGDINRTFLFPVTLVLNGSTGLYQYVNTNFFPLDSAAKYQALSPSPYNVPYGKFYTNNIPSTNTSHVYGFTMEMHLYFTYHAGQNGKFKVAGDDDLWLFINGQKVVDLGGIHSSLTDSVVLTTSKASQLGLVDGNEYIVDFFYAERNPTLSDFSVWTNLVLSPTSATPVVSLLRTPNKDILRSDNANFFNVNGRHMDLRANGLPVNTTVLLRR